MNKGRIIGGIICLLIAGFLVVANLRLPSENVMFQIGDTNMPWLPPVVLGIVGVALLATSFGKQEDAQQVEKPAIVIDPPKEALNKRLETVAWGLFLVMLGGKPRPVRSGRPTLCPRLSSPIPPPPVSSRDSLLSGREESGSSSAR